MAIRNLGDWSPLEEWRDPVYADPEWIEQARVRYQKIATTIGDAIGKLKKIVETGGDSLAGKYVEGLRDSARSVHDSLAKATVRYDDVAIEIAKYQRPLDDALRNTAGALDDAKKARAAQGTAHGMPDPQPAEDGTLPPGEQVKDRQKRQATEDADKNLNAAKDRLRRAVEDLDRAGRSFGDAVNCKKYGDGLTDKMNWRLAEILKEIAKVFSIIGMVFLGLTILFPGVNALILAGVLAGAVALGANAALYHHGEGGLVEVILGAVGIALGLSALGLAAVIRAGAGARPPSSTGRPGGNNDIEMGPMRPPSSQGPPPPSRPNSPNPPGTSGSGTGGSSGRPPTPPPASPPPAAPPGLWGDRRFWFDMNAVAKLYGTLPALLPFLIQLVKGAGGMHIALQYARVLPGLSGLFVSWAWLGSAFAFGTLVYEGGRLTEKFPTVNPNGGS